MDGSGTKLGREELQGEVKCRPNKTPVGDEGEWRLW